MLSSECDVRKCKEYEKYLLNKYSKIKKCVIGKSTLGRDIVAYTLGKEGVLVCGAFHGMERVTSAILYKFLDDMCESGEDVNLTVVPMINPDGVEISINGVDTAGKYKSLVENCLRRASMPHTKWQANARGVDINHNFDAGYETVKNLEREMGITAPAHARYGGMHAESESETKALCDFCRNNNVDTAVALHTQGREIYYDFGVHTPKYSRALADELSALSGYEVSHPQGIAVGGGFKDWFIEHFKRVAFTFECGIGENPLPPQTLYTEYSRVSKMLWHLLYTDAKKRR